MDRDVRTDAEVQALRNHNICTLTYAEIENLLCSEGLVRLVATHLSLDPITTLHQVGSIVSQALASEIELQSVLRAERRLRYKLSCFARAGNDEAGLNAGMTQVLANVDVSAELASARAELSAALSGTLNTILQLYNRKSLCARVAPAFGLVQGGYQDLLLRLLNGDKASVYLTALRAQLPPNL